MSTAYRPAMGLLAVSDDFMEALPWLIALLVVVLAAGAALLLIRKAMLSKKDDPIGSGLTAEEIDRLAESGLMTPEEFRRMRRLAMGLPPVPPADPADRPDAAMPGSPGNT